MPNSPFFSKQDTPIVTTNHEVVSQEVDSAEAEIVTDPSKDSSEKAAEDAAIEKVASASGAASDEETLATEEISSSVPSNDQNNAHDRGNTETTIVSPPALSPSPKKKFRFLPKLWQKILFAVFLVLLALVSTAAVFGFYTYNVAMDLKARAAEMKLTAQGAYDQLKVQNLPEVEQSVKKLKEQLGAFEASYQRLSFYRFIPVANNYYNDGQHGIRAAQYAVSASLKSVEAVTPYADVLGFKGQGSYTGGGTAEDRLKIILETLAKIMPIFDQITADVQGAQGELAQIDPQRYPETIRLPGADQDLQLRSLLRETQAISTGTVTAMTQFRPAIEKLPAMAGGEGKRKKYMILFQNDNELRPTGGFLTAFAIVYVENGKVTPDKSDDIYEMDKKFTKKLPIPPVLGKYLTTEKRFNIRDMNIHPDFKTSMDLFTSNYKQVKGEPADIDGVIAIDTEVLVDLLKIIGPVEVPERGTFSAENNAKCDCPQIIYALSEIITKPTPYIREDRKGILGPMMRAILTKSYTAPKTLWPDMFKQTWANVESRHIQMYFFDESLQQAAETIGAAGRMKLDPQAQDFLAIVDANLGGAKSNLFVTSEVKQEVSAPANGVITKKVTITYKNSHKADNCNLEAGQLCLNSTLRDWHRSYVPKGAKLIEAKGFKEGTAKQYDEGEFTVIDGEFILEPMSQAKLEISYTVPYTDTAAYKVKLWKQGGVEDLPVEFDVNGGQEKITVEKDKVYEAKF